MTKFLIYRLGQSIVLVFIFLAVTYLLIQLQPGDVTSRYVGDPNFTAEDRAAIAASLGLDKPLWQQFLIYIGNFFQGDFGTSFFHNRPVIDIVLERLPRTLMLFLTAVVISFYLGFLLGKISAWRRTGVVDVVTTVGGVYTFTIYTPWLALVFVWFFGAQLGWFPLQKFITVSLWREAPLSADNIFGIMLGITFAITVIGGIVWQVARRRRWPRAGLITIGAMLGIFAISLFGWLGGGLLTYVWDITSHMVLPILVLLVISTAGIMLLTRTSMLETLKEDYVLVARAKGLPERVVRDKYVSRNALLPVVTALTFALLTAIDGGVITETSFTWPGLGLTLVEASQNSDLPLAVGAFLFVGMFALVAHIVADILYVFLDPRIRYS